MPNADRLHHIKPSQWPYEIGTIISHFKNEKIAASEGWVTCPRFPWLGRGRVKILFQSKYLTTP